MSGREPARALQGKVCLVTGATAGLGLVTARELARQGAQVLGVGRSPERCAQAVRSIEEQTGGKPVDYLVADLSSQQEIRRLAWEVQQRVPRLDVLINNAGGIYLKRLETVDGIEMTFALNHLAYFLVTNLLLGLIKASAPARIVSVASAAHQGSRIDFDDLQGRQHYSGWRAYQQSKLANILFTYELARRLEGTGVTANALHPGYVNTQIFRAEGIAGWLLRRAADLFAVAPEQGARTAVSLAASPEVEGITGKYFVQQKPVPSSPLSYDEATARRLWELSEAMTGLKST